MKKDNLRLKRSLVIQSFSPLFILLTIKHLDINLYFDLICKCVASVRQNGIVTLVKVLEHPALGGLFVSVLGIVWLIITIFIAFGFIRYFNF